MPLFRRKLCNRCVYSSNHGNGIEILVLIFLSWLLSFLLAGFAGDECLLFQTFWIFSVFSFRFCSESRLQEGVVIPTACRCDFFVSFYVLFTCQLCTCCFLFGFFCWNQVTKVLPFISSFSLLHCSLNKYLENCMLTVG